MIRRLKTKDKSEFMGLYMNRIKFGSYKGADKRFLECLKHGNTCIVNEEGNRITGMLIICGFKEKSEKKHVLIYTKYAKVAKSLLKALNWYYDKEVHVEIEEKDPLFKTFRKQGFRIKEKKSLDILLVRSQNANYSKSNKNTYRRPVRNER